MVKSISSIKLSDYTVGEYFPYSIVSPDGKKLFRVGLKVSYAYMIPLPDLFSTEKSAIEYANKNNEVKHVKTF